MGRRLGRRRGRRREAKAAQEEGEASGRGGVSQRGRHAVRGGAVWAAAARGDASGGGVWQKKRGAGVWAREGNGLRRVGFGII